eukprot:gene17386-22935_t
MSHYLSHKYRKEPDGSIFCKACGGAKNIDAELLCINVLAIAELISGIRELAKQQKQSKLLKSRSRSHISIIRGLRHSNEICEPPTPIETDMTVYGQGFVYENVTKLGVAAFDVYIRRDLSGQSIYKCVIRPTSFNDTFEVSFCFTATDLKNQWNIQTFDMPNSPIVSVVGWDGARGGEVMVDLA